MMGKKREKWKGKKFLDVRLNVRNYDKNKQFQIVSRVFSQIHIQTNAARARSGHGKDFLVNNIFESAQMHSFPLI